MDNPEEREEVGRIDSGDERVPATWVRTEDLECELWNAIAEDFSQPFCEVPDHDGEEDSLLFGSDFADEEELRGSVFRQLADLRPGLGELLSGPRPPAKANQEPRKNT